MTTRKPKFTPDILESAKCNSCGSKMISLKYSPLGNAAPSMYEALEAGLKALSQCTKHEDFDTYNRAVNQMNDALRSARGDFAFELP